MSTSVEESMVVNGNDCESNETCKNRVSKINISLNKAVIPTHNVTLPKYVVGLSLATHGAEGDSLGCDEAETIFIGWSIIDSRFGKIISTRSSFVQPSNFAKVDWALLKQRGVEEKDLRNAPNLGQVIQEFDVYLHEFLSRDNNNNVLNPDLALQDRIPNAICFVVDGSLPIRQCLHPEASKKGMVLSTYYWSFYNLKTCLKTWLSHNNGAKTGSADQADGSEKLEDEVTGPDSNGNLIVISDGSDQASSIKPKITESFDNLGKSISKLIIECRQKGFLDCFAEPEVVKPSLEHGICSKDDVIDSNTVIRARGLPWQSSDEDVAKFFSGLNIAKGGVALVLSQLGRRNGEALVRFETTEEREMGLRRHRHFMGDRYIEVYRATGEDFIKLAAGNNDAAQQFLSLGEAIIVRMRGLPYDCTAEKIIEFFKSGESCIEGDLDPEKDILFVSKIDGKATGDAFVRLSHKGDDHKALAKHKEVIGTRYIELFRSTTAEVQQVLNKTMEPLIRAQPEIISPIVSTIPAPAHCLITNGAALPAQAPMVPGFLPPPQQILVGGSRKDCIRLRGLPYEAQVQHILDFLGDFSRHVLLQGVHMVLNAQGHPSGEAFIQLDGEVAALAAANDRHNKYMQIGKKQRYIEVFQCSADDMNLVLTGPATFQPPSLISTTGAMQTRPMLHPGANFLYQNPALAANLLPAAQLIAQQNQFAQNAQFLSAAGALQAGLLSPSGVHQAFPNILSGAGRLPIIPNFTGGLPTGHMTSPGALFYWPYPSPPVSPSNYYAAIVAQAHQQPGMVLLRNLAVNVTINDILNLFQGCSDLTAECVQIQRTPTGQATGEALVTFPNRVEAERAVIEKNRQIMHSRPVELYLYGI